jgi:two-component system, NtrC family, sensor kinase
MTPAVLIVDDSMTVRMDLQQAFDEAGQRTLVAATAAEARAILAAEDVAVLILDLILPDGDGLDLLREIRSTPGAPGLPVLLLSTEAEVKDRVRGLEIGADDYIGKPYDSGYVVSRARELMRGAGIPSRVGPPTILVIDDSPTFRAELHHLLAARGYTVVCAESGEQGLRQAASCLPAAIVVDGMMPGIDGATVIRRVRLDMALRSIPCILLTASNEAGVELGALDAGADAFVRKDDDPEIILARLAAVLRSAASDHLEAATQAVPRRILAVDDSATFLEELSILLRGEGYEVVQARSGEEALEMLAAQLVDCILLDLLMPGIGGQETCRRIKGSPVVRDIPLILLTGTGDKNAMIDGLTSGADDFISKSSEFEVLKARVRAQIRRKQFEDEHRRVREELLRREIEAAEARAAREAAEIKASLADELERKNKELEAFSYSVSHDLRAPLRAIEGFGTLLAEEYAERLDERGLGYLLRVRQSSTRMGELIEDLLELSRIGRAELRRVAVDLADLAHGVIEELHRREPERTVAVEVARPLAVEADPGLLRIVLENLIGNAWKFTSKAAAPRIDVGVTLVEGASAFYVRDNGAGFQMRYADKLFAPFQRLHKETDFPGTGIGLATVHRIIDRHGGRVWAESAPGSGTTLYFTVPARTAKLA